MHIRGYADHASIYGIIIFFVLDLLLCEGGPLKSGSKESGFDKAEVSSNSFRLQKLFDGDSSTYWESSGRSGTHWIRLHFHHGMVIKWVCLCGHVCVCVCVCIM